MFLVITTFTTPESPILLPRKSTSVNAVLTLIASERKPAPESPVLLKLKFKLVNTVLTLIASERESPPVSLILVQISQYGIGLLEDQRGKKH